MSIKQLLRLKTTEKHVCQVYNKNTLRIFQVQKPLYDDYFLTRLGIFKFKFDGFFGKSPVWHTIVILPNTSEIKSEDKI